jgi:hypothetical protein
MGSAWDAEDAECTHACTKPRITFVKKFVLVFSMFGIIDKLEV